MNYVGGKFVKSQATDYIELKQPAYVHLAFAWMMILMRRTNKVVTVVPKTTQSEMNQIAEVAQKAYLEWRKVPLPQRVRTMYEYRDRLTKNLDKIAETITHEVCL
jgi:malonate-semialdehyde dehydrogenase (acetylating)/methylmalonate-semialdehyde dehydrogenase